MGYFYGNVAWGWLCLIPVLVMLGFMVMMFVMGRRFCMGIGMFGKRMAGGLQMESQEKGKWKGMQGSMMHSCMEMMSRRMQAATHDKSMQEVFDHWSKDLEKKILDLTEKRGSVTPPDIAATLEIPEEVALSLIRRLASEGKVRIGSIEKAK